MKKNEILALLLGFSVAFCLMSIFNLYKDINNIDKDYCELKAIHNFQEAGVSDFHYDCLGKPKIKRIKGSEWRLYHFINEPKK